MSMPDEVREAFKILDKYEYKEGDLRRWEDFQHVNNLKDYEFRLKKEKPLTVKEAEKLERVYVPFPTPYAEPDYDVFATLTARKAWAEKGAAYATPKGAIAHAKMWFDAKVKE